MKVAELFPGVAAAGAVAGAGHAGADLLGGAMLAAQGLTGSSPLSAIPVSIILGIGLANTVGVPGHLKLGLTFCSTTLLRAGIVTVGLKLSLLDVLALGATGVPVVLASMGVGLAVIPELARRAGLPGKLGSLLAAGTSVCGVTAITAASPVIRADPKDTALAVANVVAFGTLGMLAYPYLAHALLPGPVAAGTFLGVAVHDTSQVLGSAATYHQAFPGSDEVLKAAAVTKLTRNLLLAGVIPGLAYQYRHDTKTMDPAPLSRPPSVSKDSPGAGSGAGSGARSEAGSKEGAALNSAAPASAKTLSGLATFQQYVPGFVVAFVGAAAVRSLGDYGLEDPAAFDAACGAAANLGSTVGLGMAMSAVGLSTSAAAFRGGDQRGALVPFVVGGAGAVAVGGTGFSMIHLISHLAA